MSNPLLTEDIGVHFLNMDTAIEEQVVYNADNSFSIFINARISNERQMIAYQHALKHILNNDFNKKSVDDIETDAHGLK